MLLYIRILCGFWLFMGDIVVFSKRIGAGLVENRLRLVANGVG